MANMLPGSRADLESGLIKTGKQNKNLKAQLASIRKSGREAAERSMNVAISVGAAAGAGYMAKQFPGQWMSVDKEIWLGGGFLALGLLGVFGDKVSDPMVAAGSGILSAYVYNRVAAS